jgi:hypothetical protein
MPFDLGRKRGWGKGRGRAGRGREGGTGNCICPACRQVVPHEPGVPCFQRRCPSCGAPMMRQFGDDEGAR